MAILAQLGINQTLFLQLFIFLFTFPLLAIFVFRPYLDLVLEREKKTKGSEDSAVEIRKKTNELTSQYENKARKLSGEIKTIFDDYRQEANLEYQNIISKAREESQKILNATKEKVSFDLAEASKKISSEVPELAKTIKQKMLKR
jgi:F-type H+-transporting ATPase subunit b